MNNTVKVLVTLLVKEYGYDYGNVQSVEVDTKAVTVTEVVDGVKTTRVHKHEVAGEEL